MAHLKDKQPRYTVIIQWDPQDELFVVSLPEWGPYCKTHGATYEEAAKNAREVLELLMNDEDRKSAGLPAERLFHHPGADVIDLPEQGSAQARAKPEGSRSRKSA